MYLLRFRNSENQVRVAAEVDSRTYDLAASEEVSLTSILESKHPLDTVQKLIDAAGTPTELEDNSRLCPIEAQEVWAAGVTYMRSKKARMEESDFSAIAYDKVYEADRPEIFFKSIASKVVGSQEAVGIRADATWNVPEPELTFVMNSKGAIAGYTIGNDMSSRDIEGENLLYLPQAKVYDRSAAIGPRIRIGVEEEEVRSWTIGITIERNGKPVFQGSTSVDQIKRSFHELASYLFRSQTFPSGVMLMTGTGVVPDESFTLTQGDKIRIDVSGIGTLINHVITV